MANGFEILEAAGRAGLGSDGAASASASASGMAQRVRAWAQSLADSLEAEIHELEGIYQQSMGCAEIQWESLAGDAFRKKLALDTSANMMVRGDLSQGAQGVRLAGESVASALESLAQLIGGAGAVLDAALMGLGSIEDVMDDVVLHAERAGIPALKGALDAHLNHPLLSQTSGTLASWGR